MGKPVERSSRLSGFYQKSVAARVAIVREWASLSDDEAALLNEALSVAQADKMVENVVGRFALPIAVAANFRMNGRDYLVPMVVEEPSVVAAVSFAARLAREGGGFFCGSSESVMIGQVQLLDVPDLDAASQRIAAAREELLALARTSRTLARLGGGPIDLQVRRLQETPAGPMLIVHLLVDVRDAMGANAVNTAAEAIAPALERISGGRALLRILSNYSDRRRAWADVVIPAVCFSGEEAAGLQVVRNIAEANAFAQSDIYRAVTHNKGILNGVDAVAVATGNDWRAAEAGAHAWAARDGQYRSLTQWEIVEEPPALPAGLHQDAVAAQWKAVPYPALHGRLEIPLAAGIVGGTTRAHPLAQVSLKILGVQSARELAEVMVGVGMASNLAALRALATEGIQRGHMSLHARQIAVAAGAQGSEVDRVANQMVREGEVRLERAQALMAAASAKGTGG